MINKINLFRKNFSVITIENIIYMFQNVYAIRVTDPFAIKHNKVFDMYSNKFTLKHYKYTNRTYNLIINLEYVV